MKKLLNIFSVLLLSLSLFCGTALAASTVTYEGGAEKFVFLPGSEQSDTDLFENFKNVLPGDVLSQTIRVDNATDSTLRVYMRAEPVEEAHRDFLSQLTLTVDCEDTEIFNAPADQTALLTENVLLGTIKGKGSVELTANLQVPADLGNEFMGTMGIVPWTFFVEEFLPIDGTITVTKQVSIMDDGVLVPLEGSGLTYYVGLFTDAEGTKPYGTDHIKAITISEGAAGTAKFTHVPEGTYYVFETLEDGTIIHPDEHVDAVFPAFTSRLESAEQKVVFDPLLEVSQADVVFNNVLDELPSGFYIEAEILITKTVLDEDGEKMEADDTFYAGLFTKEDGKYVLNDVIELEQNDTVSTKVLAATGENPKPSKYWIFETDEDGKRVGGSGFDYKISGEGAVKVSKDELSAEIEIVNTLKTPEEIESESEAEKQEGVKTGDSTPVMMYMMLCMGALLMMCAMGVVRRRRG